LMTAPSDLTTILYLINIVVHATDRIRTLRLNRRMESSVKARMQRAVAFARNLRWVAIENSGRRTR